MKKPLILGKILYKLCWPPLRLYVPYRKSVRVILENNGKILLVKSWFSDGKWRLPGGGVKYGESPRDAACREVLEELGIKLSQDSLDSLGWQHYRENGIPTKSHVFALKINATPNIQQNSEVVASKWLDERSNPPGKEVNSLVLSVAGKDF